MKCTRMHAHTNKHMYANEWIVNVCIIYRKRERDTLTIIPPLHDHIKFYHRHHHHTRLCHQFVSCIMCASYIITSISTYVSQFDHFAGQLLNAHQISSKHLNFECVRVNWSVIRSWVASVNFHKSSLQHFKRDAGIPNANTRKGKISQPASQPANQPPSYIIQCKYSIQFLFIISSHFSEDNFFQQQPKKQLGKTCA